MINAMYALKSNIVGTVYPYTQISNWKPIETNNVRDALYNAHISKGKREVALNFLCGMRISCSTFSTHMITLNIKNCC